MRHPHPLLLSCLGWGLAAFVSLTACAKDYPDVPASEHAVFGKQLLEIDPPSETEGGVISPDGTRIATTNAFGKQLFIWDGRTGEKIKLLKRDYGPLLTSLAVFTPNSRYILYPALEAGNDSSRDNMDISFDIIDAANGSIFREVRGPNRADWPNGWNSATSLAIDGTGDRAGSGISSKLSIYNFLNGAIISNQYTSPRSIEKISLSYSGSLVAAGYADGAVELRNLSSGLVTQIIGAHIGQISQLIFDKAGKRLFTAARATALHNMQHMQQYLNGTDETNIADEESVRVWDVNTGKLIRTFPYKGTLHTGTEDIALSPDERTLVAAKTYREDTHLVAYDVDTGRIIDQLTTSPAPLQSVSFTADGKTLCVAAKNVVLTMHVNNSE